MGGPNDVMVHLDTIYDQMVGLNRECTELSTETGLAYKWESSPDMMTWTFYLREGILFPDGVEATAEDCIYSIERCMGPKSVSSFAGTLNDLIKEIEVVGPYELAVHFNSPNFNAPYWFSRLQATEGMIVPKHYVEEVGDEVFNSQPMSLAAYQVVDREMGVRITCEAIDKHWYMGVPKFKQVEFRLVPELSTRIAMLKTGEADIIDVSRDKIPELEAAGFTIFNKEDSLLIHLFMQMAEPSPLDDIRVREALVISINRAEIVEYIMKGGARLSENLIGSWSAAGYEELPLTAYDPDRAKTLLEEAGYSDGFDITVYSFDKTGFPESKSIGEAVAGYYEAIGIKATIEHTDYGTYRGRWADDELNYPAVTVHAIGNRLFHDSLMRLIWHSEGLINAYRPGVAEYDELDRLIEAWQEAPTLEEYGERLAETERHRYDQWLSGLICATGGVFAASDKVSKDWQLGMHPYAINVEYLYWEE